MCFPMDIVGYIMIIEVLLKLIMMIAPCNYLTASNYHQYIINMCNISHYWVSSQAADVINTNHYLY